jgi:hypothetical protein
MTEFTPDPAAFATSLFINASLALVEDWTYVGEFTIRQKTTRIARMEAERVEGDPEDRRPFIILWGQHLGEGDKIININGALKNILIPLAKAGGGTKDIDGIRYQFELKWEPNTPGSETDTSL